MSNSRYLRYSECVICPAYEYPISHGADVLPASMSSSNVIYIVVNTKGIQ